jgi:hypothetical protein
MLTARASGVNTALYANDTFLTLTAGVTVQAPTAGSLPPDWQVKVRAKAGTSTLTGTVGSLSLTAGQVATVLVSDGDVIAELGGATTVLSGDGTAAEAGTAQLAGLDGAVAGVSLDPSNGKAAAVASTIGAWLAQERWATEKMTVAQRADGASYTGALDTTTAVQALIDEVSAAGGGTIRVPPGKWLWNNLVGKGGVTLVGEVGRVGIPYWATTAGVVVTSTAAGWAIDTPASQINGFHVKGIDFTGPGGGVACGGIRFQNVRYGGVSYCRFRSFGDQAIYTPAGQACNFEHNIAVDCLLIRDRASVAGVLDMGASTDWWVKGGQYTASVTASEFNARVITGTMTAANTLAAGTVTTDNKYKDWIIEITAGTGAGQVRRINASVAATQAITPSVSFAVATDGTSQYRMFPAVCVGIKASGATGWASDATGELSEAGWYISSTATPHRITGARADLNVGPGLLLDGWATLANCHASRSGQAANNTYDGYLVLLAATKGVLAGCSAYGFSADTNKPRYGFNDTHAPGNTAQWRIPTGLEGQTNQSQMINIPYAGGARAAVPLGNGFIQSTGTTLSVDNLSVIYLNYGSAETITAFTNGFSGQVIDVIALTGNATIQNSSTLLTGTGANLTLTAQRAYRWINRQGTWYPYA